MPGVIRAPLSLGTLPHSLSVKFTETRSVQIRMNEYHDGSCQRVSLVTGSRRTWKLSKRLDPFHLGLLRAFCDTVQGGAFQFYNPFETLPVFTKNPIGTSGLYLVRFNGDWSQSNGMIRSDCDLEIVEVSATGAIDIGAPIVPDRGPGPGGNDGGGGTGGGLPRFGTPVPIDPVKRPGRTPSPGDYFRNYGPIAYSGSLWAFPLTEANTTEQDNKLGVYRSLNGVDWVRQDLANAPDEASFPVYPYWDGTSSVVTMLAFTAMATEPRAQTLGSLVDFDMNTASFSAPYGTTNFYVVPAGGYGDGNSPFAFTNHPYIFKLSSGTLRVVYGYYFLQAGGFSNPDISQEQVYYQDYAGTAWSSRQLLPGQTVEWNTYYSIASAVQDGDVIHVVYVRGSDENSNGPVVTTDAYYLRINADGTMTDSGPLGSVLSPDGSYFSLNTGVVSGNSLILPAMAGKFSDTPTQGVLIGTPKNAPTFTYVPINTPNTLFWGTYQMSHLGTQDTLAYIAYNADTFSGSQVYMSQSTDHGATWSAPTLQLDIEATPLTPVSGVDTVDINSLSLGKNLDGSVGLIFENQAGAYYAPPIS